MEHLPQAALSLRATPGSQRRRNQRAAALQGRPEPRLVDPVEVVLLAVDEDDRDQLGVLLAQAVVVEDRQLLPAGAGVGRDAFDHHPGVVAQMTAGLADQGDPGHRPSLGPARGGVDTVAACPLPTTSSRRRRRTRK